MKIITKNTKYFTGLVFIMSFIILILSFIGGIKVIVLTISVAICFGSGIATHELHDTRCKKCGIPFAKKDNLEKKVVISIKTEPYTYRSDILVHQDGTKESIPGSEVTIQRQRKYLRQYHYCAKCKFGINKDWYVDEKVWMGESPKVKYIHKKIKG